jgi:hypothetical protein
VRFPILIFFEGDLIAAATIQEAETALEAPDVEEPGLEVFDATGRRMSLVSLAPPPKRIGPRWLRFRIVATDPVRLVKLLRVRATGRSFSGGALSSYWSATDASP